LGQDHFVPVPYSLAKGLASLVSRGMAMEPPLMVLRTGR